MAATVGHGWEGTVAALAPLLPSGRPKPTPELLSRPPFRFLHDIVSEVQRATGFAAGLFGAGESDGRSMDKRAKEEYLQKLVDVISAVLGQPVPARPSKIVAGLEPEATNVMLQMLAAAAQSGDSNAAVQAVLRRQALETGSGRAQQAGLRPEAAAGAAQCSSDDDEVEAVVFARLDNLLPALSRRMGEAQAALADSGPAVPGSQEALAQCSRVQAVAQDAAVLARCLEALQLSAHAIAEERAAWIREADKLAARVQQEEQSSAEAAAAIQRRLAALEAEVAAARRRLAGRRG